MLALLTYINQKKKRKEILEFIVQNKINSCDIFYKSQLQSGMLILEGLIKSHCSEDGVGSSMDP